LASASLAGIEAESLVRALAAAPQATAEREASAIEAEMRDRASKRGIQLQHDTI